MVKYINREYIKVRRMTLSFLWNSLPGKILMTMIVAMTPVLELRGAIPCATANGLNLWMVAQQKRRVNPMADAVRTPGGKTSENRFKV